MPRRKRNQPVKGMRVELTNLTADERALLRDPNIVTEDEADLINFRRQEQKGLQEVPFRDVLRKHGHRLVRR